MLLQYTLTGISILSRFSNEERAVVAHLYGHFDESGKYKQHPIVSLSGLVGGFDQWRAVAAAWDQLLREYELPALHAVRALHPSKPFGRMGKAATHAERAAHIEPFIKSVVENLNGLAIAVTVDVDSYSKVKELHQDYTEDPHYFAFFVVVNNILTHFSIPKEYTVGLIFDDEQQKAIRCYQLLKKLKQRIPEVANRVTSICFSDDRDAPQVQVADLFAYLSRLEAMRIFAEKPYAYESLFRSFGNVMPTGRHLCMDARFFSENTLRAFARGLTTEEFVFARRIKLPHHGTIG